MYSLFGSRKEVEASNRPGNSSSRSESPQSYVNDINETRRTNYWLWGWALSITGRILTIAGVVCPLLLGFAVRGLWGGDERRLLAQFLSIVGLLVSIGGLKLQLLGRRHRKRAAPSVLASDLRDPVVYLRPFKADLQTTQFNEQEASVWSIIIPRPEDFWGQFPISFIRIYLALLRLVVAQPRTEEEQVEDALRSIGPTIAVARPGENLSPAGFPRLKLDPGLCQEQVSALLKRASLVVLRCGLARDTEDGYWPTYHSDAVVGGLGWEIAAAVTEVPPERLILLSPFNGIEYEDFRHKVKGTFPRDLPPWVESNPVTGTIHNVIWFDKDWEPKIAPLTWIDTTWRLDTRYPLAKSLKEKFQTILGTKQTGWDRVSLVVKRLFASTLDCILVISIIFFPLIVANKGSLLGLEHTVQHSLLLVILLLSGTFVCYETLLQASGQMATFGKRLFGLVVTDASSQRLSVGASLKRTTLKMVLLPVSWITLFTGLDSHCTIA